MRIFFVLGISLLSVGSLRSQDSAYTLKKCIEYAWQNNPDVAQSVLNSESRKIDSRQVRANVLPSISASAGQNYQYGRTVDRFTNTFIQQSIRSNNFSLSGNMLLFNGLQNTNTIKQQNELVKAGEESVENAKNQIALAVASSFLSVIQANENINNAKFQIETTESRVKLAKAQVDAGVSDMTALLSLEAQLANEKLNLVTAENAYSSALLSLKNLMQMPYNEPFSVIIPENVPMVPSSYLNAWQIYEIALEHMPQVKSAMHEYSASVFQRKVSKGGFAPTIALFGSVSTVFSQSAREVTGTSITGTQAIGVTENTNETVLQPTFDVQTRTIPFGNQIKDNLGQSLGLSFSWNVFSGFQVHNQIARSNIQMKMSELNLQRIKNTLLTDINTAVNDYQAAQKRYDAALNNVNAQKLSMDYVQKRFDSGVGTSFDFIQAKNNYLQALTNETQARYELMFRVMVLEFYKGNPIKL